jgi:excisionase family DNA binding protein
MPRLYDVEKTAELMSISPWTVRAWIREGRICPVRIGRRVLVEASEISRLIDSCRARMNKHSSVVPEEIVR